MSQSSGTIPSTPQHRRPSTPHMQSPGEDAQQQRQASPQTNTTDAADNSGANASGENASYVEGFRLILLFAGLALSVFCLSLDRSILATAIPRITSEFNSLDDVAWYGSSYLLASCCFQLPFGKIYKELSARWVFLAALGIFELGSLICAVAPNSVTLIIGRAIAGVGCAGVQSGAIIIIARSLPLHKRPTYTGIIGGISGIGQVIAPTLGGVFTQHVSWRWCFWINLPLGAVTLAAVFLFVRLPRPQDGSKTFLGFLRKLDALGTAIQMPMIICLLLALQWGGLTYSWNNWRIVLCFVLFAVLLLAWFYIQYRQGEQGALPIRILRERSMTGAMLFTLGINGSVFVIVYYVPIWFQAVKDVSPQQSGIYFLACSGSMSAAAILSGNLVSRIGYYVPQMLTSTTIVSIASGLIWRYTLDTPTAYWAGTLVMFGFGAGTGMQMPFISAQTVLSASDISLGSSLIILIQTLGGAVFLSVSQNVFQSKLLSILAPRPSGVDPGFVVRNGAAGLKDAVERKYGLKAVKVVLQAYNTALKQCFLVCVVLASLTIIAGLLMEWKDVRAEKGATKKSEDTQQEKTVAP